MKYPSLHGNYLYSHVFLLYQQYLNLNALFLDQEKTFLLVSHRLE